ncbi:MAG: 3D domain-containing protein [Planctomycetes bacterium]|nr:3D domain-containing protein [Planctomycetota bacterium]
MIKSKSVNTTFYAMIALCVFCAILIIDASHPVSGEAAWEKPEAETPALMSIATRQPEKSPAHLEPFPVEAELAKITSPIEIQAPEPIARIATPILQPEPVKKTRTIEALVTAYCPCARCCGVFANGRTSTGTNAWRPGIAVDPSAIPYGSTIQVPGYGKAKADDTGYAMRRSWDQDGLVQIDIRFQYHWQARQWGKKTLSVTVTEP